MARTRIRFRMAGFEEVRRGPEAVALLSRIVNDTAAAAGDGYVGRVDQAPGKKTLGRAVGRVVTGNIEAMLDNRRHNTLIRLFDRLGG